MPPAETCDSRDMVVFDSPSVVVVDTNAVSLRLMSRIEAAWGEDTDWEVGLSGII